MTDLLPGLRDEHADGSKRGRPPGALGANIYRLNEKCNKSMWWTVCKYCYAAHISNRAAVPFPLHVRGRKEACKHLAECSYYAGVTGNSLQNNEDHAEVNAHTGTNKLQCIAPLAFTPVELLIFWRLLLEFQAEALLPDSYVELLSFRRLLVFLNARCGVPGAMPHRHIMGGRVLTEYAELYSNEQRDNVRAVQDRSGGRVNFLSDVWETISKLHVLGCMVTLFGRVMNYGLRPAGDRHDGLAIAEQMEVVIEELLASEWNVGAIVTDNAGQCGRARRILALRYPKISFVHCFAHDINNLVKAVLKTVFKQISADAAGVASYLNTSTSKWLVRAVKAMHKRYGSSFAIFTLCETRWNSMQSCFASLLRARGALEDMAFSYRNSSDLTDKLRVLGDHEFWTKLETAEKIVRPLCTASFRLQRDENTVADVVISYIEIYRGFASTELSDSLTGLVEARWNACEQPLFMLVFFLHPEYVVQGRQLPSTVLTDLDDVCQIAQYYYRRFVRDDDSGLRGEMFSWLEGDYTTSRCADFSEDAVSTFWEYERKSKQNSKLPVLALTILSIAVNTATCERLFSELALILTPKRNRMSIEKTTKHQIVRQYVREKNRREKATPTSSKKLLRTIDPSERPCLATPHNSARNTPSRTTPANPTPARTRTPARDSRNVLAAPAPTRTPVRDSRSVLATPDRHAQVQLQSTPVERVLFSEQQDIGAVAAHNLDHSEASASLPQVPAATDPAPSDPPTASSSTAAMRRQALLEDEAVEALTTELDIVALNDQHLDEYLEHFDWEEIGEYGDEDTIDMWSNMLDTPNTSNANDDGANAESDASAGDGGVDQIDSVADTTDNANDNAGNRSHFTTTRLGTCEDPIPAAIRQPYPPENDPAFPQEKYLTGIRARKTSLASLVNQQ